MPALLVDTSSTSDDPDRPPVSPITPTATVAQLAAPRQHSPSRTRAVPPPTATFRPQPPPVPINESENPDAIALRSAISLLQLQREKSKRDLKALEELKSTAVSDPKAFARSLQTKSAIAARSRGDILTSTLADISDAAREEILEDEGHQHSSPEARKDSAGAQGSTADTPKFPPIPQPQNVVRCPPVNWAKYHVVGESLDKLHEEQRRYPGSVEPPPRTQHGKQAPPHAVAAPYSPFTDYVGQPQSTHESWRAFKKSPS